MSGGHGLGPKKGSTFSWYVTSMEYPSFDLGHLSSDLDYSYPRSFFIYWYGVVTNFALVLGSLTALSSHHNSKPLALVPSKGRLVSYCQFSMAMIRNKMTPLTGLPTQISLVSLLLGSVVLSILFTVETFLLVFNDGPRSDFRAIC
jgi:hypothetical protein